MGERSGEADLAEQRQAKTRRRSAFAAGLVSFALFGWAASAIGAAYSPRTDSIEGAPANVLRVGEARMPRPASTGKMVLVLGSSQLQAVPSAVKGQERIEDVVGSTVDALATLWPDRSVTFERISGAALLPLEMLTFTHARLSIGDKPALVIAGINWDSIAHDISFRSGCRDLLREPEFQRSLVARMGQAGASSTLVAAVEREGREARAEVSPTDHSVLSELDARMTKALQTHGLGFIGNVFAQRGIRHDTFEPLLGLMTHGGTTNVHEVVRPNLDFNMAAFRTLAAALRAEGVPLLAYRVPERTDVQPLTDRKEADATLAELMRALETDGAVVIDLHDSVPNELWGWAGDSPDRSHFMLPGHVRVAQELVTQGRARDAFRLVEGAGP